MSFLKRQITIASPAAVALVIVIAVVVVVADASRKGLNLSPSPKTTTTTPSPIGPTIFKRCDGRMEPIPRVRVSSCPDGTKAGYCEITANKSTVVELRFFPEDDFDFAYLHMFGPGSYDYVDACMDNNLDCPIKAGSKQLLVHEFYPDSFDRVDSGQLKLNLTNNLQYNAGEAIICVEFPVKVV